jgi:hypothetical protein
MRRDTLVVETYYSAYQWTQVARNFLGAGNRPLTVEAIENSWSARSPPHYQPLFVAGNYILAAVPWVLRSHRPETWPTYSASPRVGEAGRIGKQRA